jgi:hypothetical protein
VSGEQTCGQCACRAENEQNAAISIELDSSHNAVKARRGALLLND